MRLLSAATLSVLGSLTFAGHALADLAPPPGFVDTCTVAKQQRSGEECLACRAYYANADHCESSLAEYGFAERCRHGASSWNAVWCRAKSTSSVAVPAAVLAQLGDADSRVSPKRRPPAPAASASASPAPSASTSPAPSASTSPAPSVSPAASTIAAAASAPSAPAAPPTMLPASQPGPVPPSPRGCAVGEGGATPSTLPSAFAVVALAAIAWRRRRRAPGDRGAA